MKITQDRVPNLTKNPPNTTCTVQHIPAKHADKAQINVLHLELQSSSISHFIPLMKDLEALLMN